MKRPLCVLFAVVSSLAILFTAAAAAEEKFPARQGMINDFAGVIPAEAKKEMENIVRGVLKQTGTSVIVATVPTIGENYLQGYVNDLYRAWGIGRKGENKGVLIFVAVKERKVRIETGYGVEGILPDGKVGEIIRNDVVPHLKRNDYGTGIFNAVKSVSKVIVEDAKASGEGAKPKTAPQKAGLGTTAIVIIVVVVLGIIGLIIWAVMRSGSRSSPGYTGSDSSYSSPTIYSTGSSSFSSDSGSSGSDSSSDSGACEGGDSGGGGSDSDY